jgi:hypothetical protein
MSASEQQWQRLQALEGRHQRLQSEHDHARRRLERLAPGDAGQLREAWRRYCEVIAALDRTASEFEGLRACPD